MKKGAFILLQCVWGLPQTILGALVYAICNGCARFSYHGAIGTFWHFSKSLSLGCFIFVTDELPPDDPLRDQLQAHEYGHCLQSLILGPLYLPLIVFPSAIWCNSKWCEIYREKHQFSYYQFYSEQWANRWAKRLLNQSLPK